MSTVKVTEKNFEEMITDEKPVLLDFYADWCAPCKMLAPVLEAVSNEHQDIVIGKVNVDDEGGLAQVFGVSSIPTLVLIKDRKIVSKNVGLMTRSDLLKFIGK